MTGAVWNFSAVSAADVHTLQGQGNLDKEKCYYE